MWQKMLIGVVVGILSIVILVVSLARAGVEVMTENGSLKTMGKNEVVVESLDENGRNKFEIYKLPETGIMPDNPTYVLKKVRDSLWLTFSQGINKPKIALLLADKKAAESRALMFEDKSNLAIESGNEAIDKLEYAYNLSVKIKNDVAKRELLDQIYKAGFAYEQVFSESGVDKNRSLINRINEWNKNQEKINHLRSV